MYSSYYGKDIELNEEEKETLLDIYEDVAKSKGFEPDYEERELVDFEEDINLLDTVLYHVETFGKNHPDFGFVAELFDGSAEEKLSLDEQMATAEGMRKENNTSDRTPTKENER